MAAGKFGGVKISAGHEKWKNAISRQSSLYQREDDIRSEFSRDYNRILHCTAYRRLRHKTQVFFATTHDHICTRIEHVNHVASISLTIAQHLGLNTELTNAIAVGHDLGHAPFGHQGEQILDRIGEKELGQTFWHERNSLRFVDELETLEDPEGREQNLNLTYAVRDGIVCHCGEVDDRAIVPRTEPIDLETIVQPGVIQPYTWEGCVVKIADKIAYLGRDIEDARTLKVLTRSEVRKLIKLFRGLGKSGKIREQINNTILIHDFIINLCKESDPDRGITLSQESLEIMNALKNFNYENIYAHARLDNFKSYAQLVLESIFYTLKNLYKGPETIFELQRYVQQQVYPTLAQTFFEWLHKFCRCNDWFVRNPKFANLEVYDLGSEDDYRRAIIDFIAGMTDSFAIKVFDEVTMF